LATSRRRDRTVVTILDVARLAGVSPMTVSRVVNDQKYVGEAMREKVMAAVTELNYQPNLAGRSLRSSSTSRVGLLYSNPSASYLNQFLVGALQQSSASGGQLILERCGGLKSQQAAVEKLLANGVDGVILPPPLCDSPATLAMLDAEGVPVVAVATGQPVTGVSAVRIDDYQGACAMTQYLLKLGHQRVGFIRGDRRHTPALQREQAFLDTMKRAGIETPEALMADGSFTYRSGLSAAQQLLTLQERPTAIFSSNDDMAAATLAVAHGLGLKIPEDLSVVGFDDTPIATTVWPELTTIHQPVSAMGRAAVSLALEEIRRHRTGQPKAATHEVMKFQLVRRDSAGKVPGNR